MSDIEPEIEPVEPVEPIEDNSKSILKPRVKRVVNLSDEERERRRQNMLKIREKKMENAVKRQAEKAEQEAKKFALREERQKLKIEAAKQHIQTLEAKKEKVVSTIKRTKLPNMPDVPAMAKESVADPKHEVPSEKPAKKKSAKKIKIINRMDSDDETDHESDDDTIVVVNKLPKKKSTATPAKKLPAAEPKKPDMLCKFV